MKIVEFKQHTEQMTNGDRNNVRKKLLATDKGSMYIKLNKNKHLQDRLEGKEIEFLYQSVSDWLTYGEVIEYKIHQRIDERLEATERVVVRGSYDEVDDIVLVISVTDSTIVTAWKNSKDDLHHTLDLSSYDKLITIK